MAVLLGEDMSEIVELPRALVQQQQKTLYANQIDTTYNAQAIADWFLLDEKDLHFQERNGKPFLKLKLADRTGSIKATWWDHAETPARVGDIVKVAAVVKLYNGHPELTIQQLFKPGPEKVGVIPDDDHFFKVSQYDPLDMWNDICGMVDVYTDGDVKAVLSLILNDPEIKPLLLRAPAAKMYHHAYRGGLLEHIRSLMTQAILLHEGEASYVPPCAYNFDLPIVLAGCILHDIGKVKEFEAVRGINVTVDGRMLGHMNIGYEIAIEKMSECKVYPMVRRQILHVIASHHGETENGAPVVPGTREALIFHFLDNLDASLAALDAAYEQPSDEGQAFTPWIGMLKTRYVKPEFFLSVKEDDNANVKD
jgi:3'-5' exoribonuclease